MTRGDDRDEKHTPKHPSPDSTRWYDFGVRASVLVMLIGCGRVGFEPHDGAIDTKLADGGISGLVVDFEFEELGGNSYGDTMGGPSATCSAPGCPTRAPGHHGQGLLFDGVDDCLMIPDTIGRFSLPRFTIAIWAQQDHYDPAGTTQFSKRVDYMSNALNSWQLEDYPDGSLAFTTNAGVVTNDQAITPAALVQLGAWHHLAITWDGAIKCVYVDGALAAMDAQPAIVYDPAYPALVGCDDNSGVAEVYGGVLDAFQVYNRALAPAEILALSQE
jgi:hypothetical protein